MDERDEEEKNLLPLSRTPRRTRWISNSQAFALILTLLNVLSIPFLRRNSIDTPTTVPYITSTHLERPSQFPFLNTLNYTATPFENERRYIFPFTLAQVNERDKTWVGEEDVNRMWTRFGVLGREDRRFVVRDTRISSIAQFKTRDFAVRTCTLRFYLLSSREYHPNSTISDEILESRNRNPSGIPSWFLVTSNVTTESSASYKGQEGKKERKGISLSVYALELDTVLDTSSLSWDTKPPRRSSEPFDTMYIRPGAVNSGKVWECADDKVYSFEFGCASGEGECVLDVWQDRPEALGLALVQSTGDLSVSL